jgi:2-amino-4-hydroxy-6-hydroxymethyldihydropteridine diphosphokinase
LHERAFVLAPLVELEPALQLAQGSAVALLQRLQDQPVRRLSEAA